MMNETPSDAALGAMDMLLHISASIILRHQNTPEQYLDWIVHNGPTVCPDLFSAATDTPACDALARWLGRLIWNATPLPDNNFRPRRLPEPGRNDPCFCGSGRKYKHCCAQLRMPELHLGEEMMLGEILNQWPATRFKELPLKQLSVAALGEIAGTWLESGDAQRTVKLLEPLFTDIHALDARAELAFDVLANAYTMLGKPRKKQRLIESVAQSRVADLRVVALQRQCSILADEGRRAEAWKLFQQAQRECPNHPAFSHLEIVMLLSEGRREEAVQRARFWIARLQRDHTDDYADLIRFLQDLVADPDTALQQVGLAQNPELAALQQCIECVDQRPPRRCYTLQSADGMASLQPNATARKLLKRWFAVFPRLEVSLVDLTPMGIDVWMPGIVEGWLDLLAAHPEALDLIDVLDDIVLALHQLPDGGPNWANRKLVEPLLQRARAIVAEALGTSGDVTLPWVIWENRPALRLLVNLIYLKLDLTEWREAIELMEWLIFTLNPNDNHGLREQLSSTYLLLGRYEEVLKLTARYPEDHMAAPAYNRVLALYRLGDRVAAQTALSEVRSEWPEVCKFLCAENPRKPRLTPGRVTYKGKDEAWYYREAHQALWEQDGALAWLRQAATMKRSK